MFCPNCGIQSFEHLKYCKQCGANLISPADQKSMDKSIETLGWVIAGTTITLLGMALGSLVLIKQGAIDATLGSVVVIMSLIGFVLVESVLLWRLLREARKPYEATTLPSSNLDTRELRPAEMGELPEPARPLGVTETTTRELEPTYRAQDSIRG